MSKVVKFSESMVADMYSKAINEVPTQQVQSELVEDIFKSITQGFAFAVKEVKSKDNPVAVCTQDQNKNMLFGVKIEFIPGDDEESGSWNTIWSFNPEDFTDENIVIYNSEDPKIEPFFVNAAAGFQLTLYPGSGTCYTLQRTMFQVLISYLDQNATEGDQFALELDGYFSATVDVVEGIKVFNFVPDEEITNLEKGDGEII